MLGNGAPKALPALCLPLGDDPQKRAAFHLVATAQKPVDGPHRTRCAASDSKTVLWCMRVESAPAASRRGLMTREMRLSGHFAWQQSWALMSAMGQKRIAVLLDPR
jgi:hypothetical protein